MTRHGRRPVEERHSSVIPSVPGVKILGMHASLPWHRLSDWGQQAANATSARCTYLSAPYQAYRGRYTLCTLTTYLTYLQGHCMP